MLPLECLPWGEVPEEQAMEGVNLGWNSRGSPNLSKLFQAGIFKGLDLHREYMLKSVLAVYRALVEKMEASKIYVLLEVLLQRRQWHPIPVLLPGESQGWGSLVGCHLWGRIELDMTEVMQQQQQTSC